MTARYVDWYSDIVEKYTRIDIRARMRALRSRQTRRMHRQTQRDHRMAMRMRQQ
jgi:hypothetical protein